MTKQEWKEALTFIIRVFAGSTVLTLLFVDIAYVIIHNIFGL